MFHELQDIAVLCVSQISHSYWRHFCFCIFHDFGYTIHLSFYGHLQLLFVDSPLLHPGKIWRYQNVTTEKIIKYLNHYHLIIYVLNIWFQDHMRKAGDVCFAEVSRDSEGTPSFWFVFCYVCIRLLPFIILLYLHWSKDHVCFFLLYLVDAPFVSYLIFIFMGCACLCHAYYSWIAEPKML